MIRKMYDSVDPNAIPTDAQMVAGYIDGITYRWSESAWNRFPKSVKVRIARRVTTNDGHVLDVEEGIPTVWPPSRAIIDWVIMRRKSGTEPTIYCNQLNDWSGIRKLFQDAGVPEPQYWVARYNNVQNIPEGAIAKQYANPPLAGGHYDLSIVADYWPGVDGADSMAITDEDVAKIWGGSSAYEGLKFIFNDAAAQNPLGGHADQIRSSLRTIMTGIPVSIGEEDIDAIVEQVTDNILDHFRENPPILSIDPLAIANAVWAQARDNDPNTGPTT